MRLLPFLLLISPVWVRATLLEQVSAEDIVRQLWLERVPVCFERAYNSMADAVTLGEELGKLEKTPPGKRTAKDNSRLETLRRINKQASNPKTIIDWRQNRFDFDYPDLPVSPEVVLDALVKADPAYVWEKNGNRYLLYPKQNSFNKPVGAFKADGLKFQDFVAAADKQIFQPAGLNYIVVIMGQPWYVDYEERVYSLSFDATDARSALTKFVNAIGPDIVWQVLGGEGFGRNLSFNPLPIRSGSLPSP